MFVGLLGFVVAEGENYTINGWTVPVFCPELTLCGDSVEPSCSSSKANTSSVICNCDPACHYFKDCCVDYFQNCQEPDTFAGEFGKAIEGICLDQFSCVLPLGNVLQEQEEDLTPSLKYLMVSQCSADWSDYSGVQEKCEGEIGAEDTLSIIPVAYMNSISFKNIYCVICNRLDTTAVAAWGISASCESDSIKTNTTESSSSLQDLRDIFASCRSWSFEPPATPSAGRECRTSVVESCDATLPKETHELLTSACESYSGSFAVEMDMVFQKCPLLCMPYATCLQYIVWRKLRKFGKYRLLHRQN